MKLLGQCIALAGLLSLVGCVMDEQFKFPSTSVPENLGDGWSIASPESAGVSADSLSRIYGRLFDEEQYYNALGLLIAADGSLIYETYVRTPGDRDRLHHVMSCTKSFTSLAFGIALSKGDIDSVNQTLYSIFPDNFPSDPAKRLITLHHLLTMQSGLRVDNSVFSLEMYVDKPSDPLRHILDKPLYAQPGDSMYYRDADPQLVSYVVQRLSGMTQENLLKENLFAPLGIRDYYWEPLHDGTTSGAHSLYMRPRDMLRVGQMLLDHGRFGGAQIIDSSWIAESTRPQVQNEWEGIIWEYGYYWWVLPEYGAFTAAGHGGQFILVVPHQRMVVVMISMPDASDSVGTSLKRFIELIRPILKKV